jgi:outer membrane protein
MGDVMKKVASRVVGAAIGLAAAALALSPARADEDGKWMVRLLATGVLPDASVRVDATPAGLGIIEKGADVSDAWTPATTITYFLTPNLAAELLCCVAQHDVIPKGAVAAALGPQDIGRMWIFPPTVTLQYHFTNFGAFKPYVGVGATYIHFFDERSRGGALAAGLTRLKVDDAFGFALQAGLDLSLGGGWYLNADVKKVFLETDATWRTAAGVPIVRADVELDPWIVSAGIGYRFNLDDIFHRRSQPLK